MCADTETGAPWEPTDVRETLRTFISLSSHICLSLPALISEIYVKLKLSFAHIKFSTLFSDDLSDNAESEI